jgi:hypothetical protein
MRNRVRSRKEERAETGRSILIISHSLVIVILAVSYQEASYGYKKIRD